MAFSITEVDKTEVFEDGGRKIIISGTFESGVSYNVYIGDHRDSTDAICYSGIPDQGNEIYPELNSTLIAYTPLLLPSGEFPYSVTVINTSTSETQTLIDILYVRLKQYFNRVYKYRSMLNPKYKSGPKAIDLEEPV